MEIREFRATLEAKDFDRTCQFYAEVLGLPRLASRDEPVGRSATYQAGAAQVEVRGPARGQGKNRTAGHHPPDAPVLLTLVVGSAEKVYEELVFRDQNVPGGLRYDPSGKLVFETHDPDGVRIRFIEA